MLNKLGILLIFSSVFINEAQQNVSYRLPDTVRPIHYDLILETSLDESLDTFNGSVAVTLTSTKATDNVTMHSKDLHIVAIDSLNQTLKVSNWTLYENTDFIVIRFNRSLIANEIYRLKFVFNGTLGDANVGFYRANYINQTGSIRYLAVTHFEATNARRAFPCFDQPNLKATFNISLIRGANYSSTANMNRISSVPYNGNASKYIDTYNTSVKMSTYLVAFLVSDYQIHILPDKSNGTYSVYGRPELINRNEGNFSLYIGRSTINAMQNFTNFSYPLIKMDQVAVPNEYYKIGAMENWGMVTYREKYLMYNETTSTASEKQTTVTLITHEFAHQWFGNLVTPKWWKYIWLNEGFATYFEMYISSLLQTDWNMMDQFLTAIMQKALDDDALESSRPMTRDVESPEEIDGIYDTIVYEKAGSVIRMVEHFLGSTVFRDGLRRYLNSWQYDNAEPQYLYNSWQTELNSASINVSDVMSIWETQSGYPVVTVQRNSETNLSLRQERFFLTNNTNNDTSLWIIPLDWFSLRSQSQSIIWLKEPTSIKTDVNSSNWIIFNRNRTGFYRVNYMRENWNLLSSQLKTNYTIIPVLNRAQLIDDSFNLARSGYLNYSIALDIGNYIRNETEYVPILTFSNVFSYLHSISVGQSFYNEIKEYGINIYEAIYNRTGFEIHKNDTHLTKLTKVNILTWLCNLGHATCRNNSRIAFTNWLNNLTVIQPDSQNFVYCNGIREGNESSWNAVYDKYNKSSEDTHRSRLVAALGCTANATIINRFLQSMLLPNTTIGLTDRVTAITSVYTNNGVDGVNLVLDFLTTHFAEANKTISNMAIIIKGVASRITTNGQYTKFTNFVKTNEKNFTTAMNETIAVAEINIQGNFKWINTTSVQFTEKNLRGSSNTICNNIMLLMTGLLLLKLF